MSMLAIYWAISINRDIKIGDRLCGLVWPEFFATDQEARVRFPALPEKKSSESGTGSTQSREYNWGATWYKSSGSCLENREYGSRDPSRWPRGTLNPQKLASTSPTSGGRSVGIVCSRTQTMEFSFFLA
jgi:ferredoxin